MDHLLIKALFFLVLASLVRSQNESPGLLHHPHIHDETVVFVRGGDLYRVGAQGGEAHRLTSDDGLELFPRISPDGQHVAFSAEYHGTRQVYVMPLLGGQPKQLTFYADVGPMPPRGGYDVWIMGWTQTGKILVRLNRTPFGERMGTYYLVDPQGGLEERLPIPHGGSASLSDDGRLLAYTPIDREFRTWKRTRGGRAQDIWIYDFVASKSERVTDYAGTDAYPMWVGKDLYFTSDRSRTLNIFRLDVTTKAVVPVTSFQDDDVLWPSTDGKSIVFSKSGDVWILHLQTNEARPVPIRIGDDHARRMPRIEDVSGSVTEGVLDQEGHWATLVARGEIFRLPAKEGEARPLHASSASREHALAISKDGKLLAWASDTSGEYEVMIKRDQGSPVVLATGVNSWIHHLSFSPDGKHLACSTQDRRLMVWNTDEAQTEAGRVLDQGAAYAPGSVSWSPDSQWIAATRLSGHGRSQLVLHRVDGQVTHMLSDGMNDDRDPAFAPDGRHLFFVSARDYELTFSGYEFNYVYTNPRDLFVMMLDPTAPPLFPERIDGETKWSPPEEKSVPETIVGDPEFAAERVLSVPGVPRGTCAQLASTRGHLFYTRDQNDSRNLYRYDIVERKEEQVLAGVSTFRLSGDGKRLLYRSGATVGVTAATPDRPAKDGALDLKGLSLRINTEAEWSQMYWDAWRITREWFYDPNMHGFDWKALGAHYERLLKRVHHRMDLDFILGELLGELEAGHTYVGGASQPSKKRVPGGKLGAVLVADPSASRYRIERILPGENWDAAWRSPLRDPGLQVQAGAHIVSIDGEVLALHDNPYRLLEGKADRLVVLEILDKDATEPRNVTVRTIGSELNLFYLEWVRARMDLADRLSGGRIGYVHVPDTATDGNRMLHKMFLPQVRKEALIIDDRYNGGGFIPDRMVELLSRRTLVRWARRGQAPMRTPGLAHDGPKAMLINGYSSSGGDALPYFFKNAGLGPLIGTRTWGGLIGLTGNPALMDGSSIQIPTFRIYDNDSRWIIENEGVAPDIEVFDVAETMESGGDPSLEAAVAWLLKELASNPPVEPAIPSPPVMGR